MAFSKSFPRTIAGSIYPKWEEVFLTEEEEKEIDDNARRENIALMKESMDDAKQILEEMGFKGFKEDILSVAVPLFEKRASHSVYWKESRCKEKFDKIN
jgi:hypothetical protein